MVLSCFFRLTPRRLRTQEVLGNKFLFGVFFIIRHYISIQKCIVTSADFIFLKLVSVFKYNLNLASINAVKWPN